MDAGSLIIFAVFIGLMYFLLIRPQRKRQKEQQELLDSLARGDDVVTIGGLHGRVHALTEEVVDLEVTDDVVLRFQKQAISRKVTYGAEEQAEASGS